MHHFTKGFPLAIFLSLTLSLTHLSGQNRVSDSIEWLNPQDIVDHAFQNARIVMMNEAHNGQKRNIRTRVIGQLILSKAHAHGVRHLAMEALTVEFAEKANANRRLPEVPSNRGYLHQPEMRQFMQAALDLGWQLIAYEADTKARPKFDNSMDKSNWREEQQAKNLCRALDSLPADTKLLIWCGNSHLEKAPGETPNGTLKPMGYQFWQLSGIEPFIIDQTVSVDFLGNNSRFKKWKSHTEQLKNNFYGTMGFISAEMEAKLISIYNDLE